MIVSALKYLMEHLQKHRVRRAICALKDYNSSFSLCLFFKNSLQEERPRPSLCPKQTNIWAAGLASLPRFWKHRRDLLLKSADVIRRCSTLLLSSLLDKALQSSCEWIQVERWYPVNYESGSVFTQCFVFICAFKVKEKCYQNLIFGLSLRIKASQQKACG